MSDKEKRNCALLVSQFGIVSLYLFFKLLTSVVLGEETFTNVCDTI